MLFKLRTSSEDTIAGLDDLRIRAERLVDALQNGAHTRRKSGVGDNFWQFRDYESTSDRPQDIDWRQSAKTSHVYVRQKELQSAQDNYIWVDKNAGMGFCSDSAQCSKLERAQILAMALALLLTRGGENIGLIGTDIRGHSERALEDFGLHLLEDASVTRFDVRKKANLFLIGDFINPAAEIEAQIAQLSERASRCFLLQILDPAELNLPYRGRVIFEGDGGSEMETEIQNVRSVRTVYQDRIAAHLREVQRACKKYGWHYVRHKTDADARNCLIALMGAQES